ncbi:prolyl-tRNA synthetase associated domain-containing protein [Alcaligenes sp. 13f]|uniref:prolyl-tRNA synthetase associated domain-containing protein n=1 Tax=Alcaligenes sp. 13f TaxID=2841924 RepID=UPI001CF65AC7|nr:prolyl-tRNA synthetase associated domain-containing protein [Alcaligenes sp. 13f]MCB4321868.1 prolyl-tRNA synthetase associated domain-containing protein [Alcaligenes sp. 13f]
MMFDTHPIAPHEWQSVYGFKEWTQETLLAYLEQAGIEFELVSHSAVFTMADSAELSIALSGRRCKNLLLRDKKSRVFFLVVLAPETSIDLAALGQLMGAGRLSLCPAEQMYELLHVVSGALSPFALIGDSQVHKVRLLWDASLAGEDSFLFHPLRNTATVSISQRDFSRFLALTGHLMETLAIPSRPHLASA